MTTWEPTIAELNNTWPNIPGFTSNNCGSSTHWNFFIPFEECKRCTKRKYLVVWFVGHFTYNIVMRKRVKLNSYEPLVRDKSMKFVTRSWYNKIFPFVKPFEFLKRNKNFQCLNLRLFWWRHGTAIVWSVSKTLILYCVKTLFTYTVSYSAFMKKRNGGTTPEVLQLINML